MSELHLPIYLDYSSTTPIDARVAQKMKECLTIDGNFGNPASRSHRFGWQAEESVDVARNQIADLVNADPRAVLDTMEQLEREGFEVSYLQPDANGILNINTLLSAIREDTLLVSVMHVNNEVGVIQDIRAIGNICRERNIIFHVDAAQSTGKVAIDLQEMNVDLMSFSAHKTYGPKGIGALYVKRRPRVRIEAQIHGGGHERGMRSGTLATHQIVGMGEAFDLAKAEMTAETARITELRERLWNGIKDIEELYINGDAEKRVPHNLNVSFNHVDGESLMMALKDIAVSTGSACTSASLEPSYVLRALGLSDELAHSSIRFSIGRFTTEAEIDYTIDTIKNSIAKLREVSTAWQDFKARSVSNAQ
jgi:cysteine desulfurase